MKTAPARTTFEVKTFMRSVDRRLAVTDMGDAPHVVRLASWQPFRVEPGVVDFRSHPRSDRPAVESQAETFANLFEMHVLPNSHNPATAFATLVGLASDVVNLALMRSIERVGKTRLAGIAESRFFPKNLRARQSGRGICLTLFVGW